MAEKVGRSLSLSHQHICINLILSAITSSLSVKRTGRQGVVSLAFTRSIRSITFEQIYTITKYILANRLTTKVCLFRFMSVNNFQRNKPQLEWSEIPLTG